MNQHILSKYGSKNKFIRFCFLLVFIINQITSEQIEFRFINKEVSSLYSEEWFYDYNLKFEKENIECLEKRDSNEYKTVKFDYDNKNGYKSGMIDTYLNPEKKYKKESILLPIYFNIDYFNVFIALLNYKKISEKFNEDFMFRFCFITDYFLFEFEDVFFEVIFRELFNNCSLFFKNTLEIDSCFFTWLFGSFPNRLCKDERFLITFIEFL
ncbi:hypothetical protein LUQ84_003085 [Hamiltosporidium tvaerminnensis]|nr:hypothetical protein LUQ84_003085 [Hamiltosporidium tvaerminnensis]